MPLSISHWNSIICLSSIIPRQNGVEPASYIVPIYPLKSKDYPIFTFDGLTMGVRKREICHTKDEAKKEIQRFRFMTYPRLSFKAMLGVCPIG
jgi:hypothetical protein